MSEDMAADTVAVAVAVDVDVEEPTPEKQGSKYCCCCCDLRRAVIVVASIGIVIQAFNFIQTISNAETYGEMDTVQFYGEQYVVATVHAVGIFFYIFQIFAAIKYNISMLAIAVVFQCILLGNILWEILSLQFLIKLAPIFWGEAIIYVVIWALFVYPTIGLIVEIKKGVMSEETYPREVHSCCCL